VIGDAADIAGSRLCCVFRFKRYTRLHAEQASSTAFMLIKWITWQTSASYETN